MPTLAVIAVYVEHVVGKEYWYSLRMADGSRSLAEWLNAKEFTRLALSMESYEWKTLQDAIKNPGQWMEVK